MKEGLKKSGVERKKKSDTKERNQREREIHFFHEDCIPEESHKLEQLKHCGNNEFKFSK